MDRQVIDKLSYYYFGGSSVAGGEMKSTDNEIKTIKMLNLK